MPQQQPPVRNPDAKQGSALWIGLVVVVVVLGVVAVLIARGGKDGDEKSTATKVRATGECDATGTSTTEAAGGSADALPLFQDPSNDDAICRTIPTVSGRDVITGKTEEIGPDGRGKVIVFVAHWCPHCQREVPLIAEHLKSTEVPAGVDFVAVSTAVDESRGNFPPKAWLEGEGWKVPTIADTTESDFGTAYGLTSFPYFVVADKDGKVVYRTSGEISTGEFDALLEAAKTGRPPT